MSMTYIVGYIVGYTLGILYHLEVCLGPCQAFAIELFCKNSRNSNCLLMPCVNKDTYSLSFSNLLIGKKLVFFFNEYLKDTSATFKFQDQEADFNILNPR